MSKLTVGDVIERVQRQFGDESGVQVTNADVIRWIDDAYREVALQNEDIHYRNIYPTYTRNDARISLDGNSAYQIYALYYRQDGASNFYEKLKYLNPVEMDEYLPGWQTINEGTPFNRNLPVGTPQFYTRSFSGSLIVYPAPEFETDPQAFMATIYAASFSPSGSLNEDLDLPEHLHNLVVEFCLMKAYEMDEDWQAAQVKAEYVQSTLDFNAGRDAWVERDTYPTITVRLEDV